MFRFNRNNVRCPKISVEQRRPWSRKKIFFYFGCLGFRCRGKKKSSVGLTLIRLSSTEYDYYDTQTFLPLYIWPPALLKKKICRHEHKRTIFLHLLPKRALMSVFCPGSHHFKIAQLGFLHRDKCSWFPTNLLCDRESNSFNLSLGHASKTEIPLMNIANKTWLC